MQRESIDWRCVVATRTIDNVHSELCLAALCSGSGSGGSLFPHHFRGECSNLLARQWLWTFLAYELTYVPRSQRSSLASQPHGEWLVGLSVC